MDTLIDPHSTDELASGDLADERGLVGGGLVGTVLDGRYELTSELGAGGMGVVYAARHVVLGNRFAVKVLRPPPAREAAEAMERFKREARAASALGHPNIVDIKDFGSLPGGSSYYVMEHLEGHDLLAEVERNGPLPAPRLAHVGAQIAEALAAAHERGIVHRDLKPENVFLTARVGSPDHVKLIDFGIAKVTAGDIQFSKTVPPLAALAMSSPSGGRFTAAGIVLGTPAYMSPEQCAGRDVDYRSDIYALGVLLYEAATGAVPFDADSVFELMRKHQQEVPRDPRELRPSIPAPMADLILALLAKDPAQRPASMDVVGRALRALDPREEARPSAEAIEAAIRSSMVAPRGSIPGATPSRLPAEDLSAMPSFAKPSSRPPVASLAAPAPGNRAMRLASIGLVLLAVLGAAAAGAMLAIRTAAPAAGAAVTTAVAAPDVATVVSVPVAPVPAAEPPAAAMPETPAVTEPAEVAAPPAPHATARPRRPPVEAHPTVTPEPSPAPAVSHEPERAPAAARPRPTDAVRDPWAD